MCLLRKRVGTRLRCSAARHALASSWLFGHCCGKYAKRIQNTLTKPCLGASWYSFKFNINVRCIFGWCAGDYAPSFGFGFSIVSVPRPIMQRTLMLNSKYFVLQERVIVAAYYKSTKMATRNLDVKTL